MQNFVVRNGLILGGIQILFSLYIYLAMPSSIFALSGISLLTFVVTIILMVVYGKKFRKLNKGFLSLKDGFAVLFWIVLIANVLTTTFGVLLYGVIDTEFPRQLTERMMISMAEFMESVGADQEQVELAMEDMEDSMDGKFSIAAQLQGFFWNLLFSSVIALIIAAVIKKEPTPFEGAENNE